MSSSSVISNSLPQRRHERTSCHHVYKQESTKSIVPSRSTIVSKWLNTDGSSAKMRPSVGADLSPSDTERPYDDRPPLYRAIEERRFSDALSRCRERPDEAKTWVIRKSIDGDIILRRLPLHLACKFRAPHKIISALLTAYVDGAQMRDQWTNLPIHYVCEEGCDDGETIRMLLRAYPESLNDRGMRDMVPLSLVNKGSTPGKKMIISEIHAFLIDEFSNNLETNLKPESPTDKGMGPRERTSFGTTSSADTVKTTNLGRAVNTVTAVAPNDNLKRETGASDTTINNTPEPASTNTVVPQGSDPTAANGVVSEELRLRQRISEVECELANILSENAVLRDVAIMLVGRLTVAGGYIDRIEKITEVDEKDEDNGPVEKVVAPAVKTTTSTKEKIIVRKEFERMDSTTSTLVPSYAL